MLKKLILSFSYAFNGIWKCVQDGSNFKIHLFVALLVVIMGFSLRISVSEWMVILLCTGFVLSMEMVNTALEQLCDVVHKEYHPGIKLTKDIAAGAVLVSAIVALVCGLLIFIPKIILFLK